MIRKKKTKAIAREKAERFRAGVLLHQPRGVLMEKLPADGISSFMLADTW